MVVVALCACGKGKSGGTDKAPADECKQVTDHLTALQLENTKNVPEAQREKFVSMMKKVGDAVTVNCREMKWSAEVTSCLKNMKSLAEGDACQAKLTPEQKASVDKTVEDAQVQAVKEMQGSAGPGPMKHVEVDTSPSGSAAPAGSAAVAPAGSAAPSGSAAK